jgi:two-component system response regulator DesR
MRIPIIEECRSPIRLLVMDRRPVYARGLEMLLAQSPELEVVNDMDADVILLSGVAPRTGALAALARARETNAHAATVMLLENATPSFVTSAHAAGVSGMLFANVQPQKLIDAMVAVHRGNKVFDPLLADVHREARVALSDRELDVLRLVGEGASPHAISRALNISKSTTRTYLVGAIRKMGAENRADAVRAARGLGWL